MIKNTIKDFSFSRLGLGTGSGFNKKQKKSEKEFHKAFDAARDNGINWLDTAEAYADGYAEELIGKYLKNNKNSFFTASKFSPINASKKLLRQACEGSLKRLNVECIDLYQIHWMNYNVPLEETLLTLNDLKDEGKIRSVGVCNFSQSELEASRISLKNISTNQIEFNLFNRISENNLMPYHESSGVLSIAYSPFDGIHNLLASSQKLKILDELSSKYLVSKHQIVLSFLSNYPNLLITFASIDPIHIAENSKIIKLDNDDIKLMKNTFASSIKYVSPRKIKVKTTKTNQIYGNLNEAQENKFGYFPGVEELASEFSVTNNFKPIKVMKLDNGNEYDYQLLGGMMRFWGWILAYGFEKPIMASVTNE
jgi:diketogulonate reductase-like aldo/keto reductase